MSKSLNCLAVLAVASAMTVANAACPLTPVPADARRDRTCQFPVHVESWDEVQGALGVYAPERFGRPGDCEAPARKLVKAWSLLRLVDLPGVGNAADFVDRHISSSALDPRLGGGVRAQFVHGSDTLILAPAFFESDTSSDAERAGTLLHEARHASDRRYKHVICGADSSLAWTLRCDHRFVAALDDPRAGAWSFEVVFHALLRDVEPCLDQDLMARRIESKLSAVFRIVTREQRKALRDHVRWSRQVNR
jgi:hypothetical protein